MNQKEFIKRIPDVVRCELCHGNEQKEKCPACNGIGFKYRVPKNDILLLDLIHK